ncbi:hypothetical protein U0035_14055 [Niabella yanshanensis]|uniref:Uncharacterized protein n=1 Tax=Niabella yanshanensis TaxID=577386 RepID=A0ABZ0W3Y1_9BACT|nr:hypothetical protein [Niabella yanshanensis]WQD36791.1 hypothetical protein U0035_14055 [Niabella yanshanensis]
MKKHIGLLLLLALGLFLAPNPSYACSKTSTKTEKATCSKKKAKKDSSKTEACKKNKHHNDCGGKCKNASCYCSTSASLFSWLPLTKEKEKDCFVTVKKQKCSFEEACYSSGYFSIWLPPKIS